MGSSDTSVSIRCADDSRAQGLDPVGSAVFFDEAVVVDVALPWPKPVFDHDRLGEVPELVELAATQGRTVRALAAVPTDDTRPGHHRVVVHRRPPGDWIEGFVRTEYLVPDDDLDEALRLIIGDGALQSRWTVGAEVDRDLLLCTQGSHDSCCGRYGMRLHEAVVDRWPGVRISRVSHTGGHRFAPTGISFPDGRYWGYLDVDRCDTIIERGAPVATVSASLRGTCGAESGFAQAAERAVFAEMGWDWDRRRRRINIETRGDTATVVVESTDPDGRQLTRHTAEIEVSRLVPVLTCGAPGGLPHTKEQREYAVMSLRRED